ncbi:MutS-related protein [Frigoriglobus tundricola]|uniref:MutS-related protein, family 1 n=1 Tax=Frigoriglobus tundricola TaxID=2774151 RepID=A0A6M5YSM9_9BACT|nr:DNA mismatch repair protein MutS [Frigoriglobus tundricola]QJW96313.1 MutS-related protein, family 1 [Frigoriglobus tundricola]
MYADRLAARRATAASLAATLDRLSYARLGAFLVGLLVAALGFAADLVSPWFTLVPVAAFFYLVAKFEATRGRKAWAERAAKFYAGGLERLAGKPSGTGDGARFVSDAHPYSDDLDLFGPGSLFERLTACRTRAGEDTLAAWLLAPATPAEVTTRQEAVADLSARLDLREAVAVAGADAPAADYHPLVEWGAAPPDAAPVWKRWAVEALGWGNVLAWFGWFFAGTSSLPVIVFGIASLVIAVPLLGWARRVLMPLERAADRLSLFESLLGRLERERFTAPRLTELQAAMVAGGRTASQQIRELREIVQWYDSRRNPLFLPVAVLRMWDVRFAFKLEAWRGRSGAAVGQWLRAVGEAEALSSFAGYAFENPTDIFPTVETGPVRVAATGVGHPLLPCEKAVRNDVNLGGNGPRVLIVSGSNMSGKSTLLRAVGVNCVLALAGGVVRATSFALTPVAVGATMRVQDSLQAGRSRFFAEVTKVRLLLDIATRVGGPPLLFLLDELFAGTNSADRVAGAEGVVRALLADGAIGFVTTHDLSLTAVTDTIPGAVNVHFCDGLEGGELHFDYTMRPGVVPHGNGLALMRAVGLKV